MIYEENVTVYPGVDTGLVNAFDEAIAIYGARLTNGPTLQPGQKYWISIMENDPLTQIPFIWMNSDINNGYFAYDPGCNNPQLFETFEFDDWGYAFTLIGNAVQ
jgi:hypothetical protein